MAQNLAFLAFNRGLISSLGLARSDIKRVGLSAETMTNWMPRVLGSMSIRPGLGYLGSTASNAAAKLFPFIYATDDKALLEFTALAMRVWIDDAVITRTGVSSAVANGTFTTDLSSWTDIDESGGTSVWVTGSYMGLTGSGTLKAIRYQLISVVGGDVSVEHGVKIVINRGPVGVRIGSTLQGGEYMVATLQTGTHSLAITPSGSFYIQLESVLLRQVLVTSVAIEAAGAVSVTTPWPAASDDDLRFDQSGNDVFVACDGYQQRKIQRRGTRSWSVELFLSNDGPFETENTTVTTITPSGLSGNITLTASTPIFYSTHVGALFQIISDGQTVTADVSSENSFTTAINVEGVDATRVFTLIRAGTWVATVTLQQSLTSATGPWSDMTTTYTTNGTVTIDDTLDNQIAWYRIGVKTGGYTSGTATLTLDYAIGSITGAARVTAYTSTTVVSAEVITALGDVLGSDGWSEGSWSDRLGWPTAVGLYEGRLAWAGKDKLWLSVSDAYNSNDADTEGDSGPIARNIGSGPVDTINWIVPVQRLILGGQGAEFEVKTSSFDDPITPTNFSIKPASTQGSAAVQALKIDKSVVYIQRGGIRVFEMRIEADTADYGSGNMTSLIPDLGDPGFVRMAVQRQPDTRIHCVRSDGTVAIAVYDKIENVVCWCDFETDGDVEDVVVMQSNVDEQEDGVYYVVNRTINGSTKRYLEKWAYQADCVGGTLSNLLDSYISTTRASSTSVTGLSSLEGETVLAWADGLYAGSYTVSSGAITLSTAAASVVVGLAYTAQWKSGKLTMLQSQSGSTLSMHKAINSLGLILANVHPDGLQYGPDFSNINDLPGVIDGAVVSTTAIIAAVDTEPVTFGSEWGTDPRLCLQASAPLPVTILAAIAQVEAYE